jgi:hypothetical protein
MKEWLQENKIFFEIIHYIVITLASCLFGYASFIVAQEQLLISKNQIRPHLSIEEVFKKNKETGFYDNTELHLSNDGTPINNVTIISYSILTVEKSDSLAYIPLDHFYFGTYSVNKSAGKLKILKGYNNNKKLFNLRQDIHDKNINKYDFRIIELNHIIEVSYIDRLNNKQYQYFRNEELVEKEYIENDLNLYENSDKYSISIDDISLKKLNKPYEILKIDFFKEPK